jgi:transposase
MASKYRTQQRSGTYVAFKNLAAREGNLSVAEIAKRLGVGTLQATAWMSRYAKETEGSNPG